MVWGELMRKFVAMVAGLTSFVSATWAAAETPPTNPPVPLTPVTVTPLPAGTAVRPFGFTHLYIKLDVGKVWWHSHGGLFCLPGAQVAWKGGQQELKNLGFEDILRSEVTSAGFKVDGDPGNLFDSSPSASDLQVAGLVTDLDFDTCMLYIGYNNTSTIKGHGTVKVQWQIYSSLQKTVLAKVETLEGVELKNSGPGGIDGMIAAALRENARAFIASPEFRKTFTGSSTLPGEVLKPTSGNPVIHLLGPNSKQGIALSDAVGSVVLISAGASEGSGFLASTEGMLLTARHVVGDAKFVKVRWPDGIESLGEVVRSDKARDVALIKTDSRGRQPLALRLGSLQPGEPVFAIGSPLGEKFQSTVTRGVVSASRTFEGLNYIQSDVSVNPGSSGGPLLDEKGAVVGLTESGFRVAGAPTSINLFTPIRDALDFLAASVD